MATSILVTYATQYGSTKEVSAAIAEMLINNGADVDIQPMRDIAALNAYDAVILGTPLYIGAWHTDMHLFLSRHKDALMKRRVAVFTLGPLTYMHDEIVQSTDRLNVEMDRYDWLKPDSTALFVGKYDPNLLNPSHRLIAALPASPLHDLPASDNRDWDAIHEWASEVAEALMTVNAEA